MVNTDGEVETPKIGKEENGGHSRPGISMKKSRGLNAKHAPVRQQLA